MLGRSAKKKRLGSRRNVSRQKEMSEDDEFHVSDSSSAAHHVAEESTEEVNLMSNPDEFRLENNKPVPMNRRKLGSSRRLKGRQHGQESEIDTCPEVREEVEEHARGQSTFQTTRMSEAVQAESQMEICQESKHAITAPLKSLPRSTLPHEYYSEALNSSPTICPEEAMESSSTKNENKLQSFPNEEIKENPHEDRSSQLNNPSVLLCPSVDKQLVNVSPLKSMDMPDQGLSRFYSVEEIESNKSGYTDLITKRGHLQGSSLLSDFFEESVVFEFKTPEIKTDQSSARENIEVKHSLEPPMFSSAKGKAAAKEEHNFNLFEGTYAQHSEEVVSRVNDETQDVYRNEYFPQGRILHPPEDVMDKPYTLSKDEVSERTNDDENSETIIMPSIAEEENEESTEGDKHNMAAPIESSMFSESEKGLQVAAYDKSVEDTLTRPNESDSLGSEEIRGYRCSVDEVKNKLQEEVKPTPTEEIMPMLNISERVLDDAQVSDISEIISESPTDQTEIINTYQPNLVVTRAVISATNKDDSNSDGTQNENQLGLDTGQQTETVFGCSGNRSVLESSSRNEGRQQITEFEVELSDNTERGETSETITMPLTTETKKEQSLSREYDTIPAVSHDSPPSLMSTVGFTSEVHQKLVKYFPDEEMESATPKCRNILEDQDMRETDFKMEASDLLGETKLDNFDSSDPLESEEVKDVYLSDDDEKKVFPDKVNPAPRHHASYHVLQEAIDLNDSEIIHVNPTEQIEIPKPHQSEVRNAHDPATKQQDVFADTDPMEENPTVERDLTLESKSEWYFVADSNQTWLDHTKLGDISLRHDDKDQLDNDFKHGDEKSVDQDTDIFDPKNSNFSPGVNEQTETSFNSKESRRKLGSSRRIKGRQQVKRMEVDAAENTEEPDTPEMTVSLTLESRQAVGQLSESDVILSASNNNSVISTSTPDHSSETLNPALTNYTETDLQSLIPHGQLQEDRNDMLTEGVVKEGLFDKSENITMEECDKSVTLETEEVRGLHHAEENEQTQIEEIQLTHNTLETILDDADDNPENILGNLKETEIKGTNQYEAMANNFSDSATKQKHSLSDDPQDSEYKGVTDQSQCSQMSHDELSSIVSVQDEGIGTHTQLLTREGNEPDVSPMTLISPDKSGHEEQTQPEQSVDVEVDMSVPVQKREVAQDFCESLIAQNYPGDICQPELERKRTEDCPGEMKFSDHDNQQVLSEQNSFEAIDQDAHDTEEKEVDDIERVHTVQFDMLTCAENTTDKENKGHFRPLQQNITDSRPDVNQGTLRSSKDEFTVTLLEKMSKPDKSKTECVNVDVDAKQKTHFSGIAPLSECTSLTVDQQLIKSESSETTGEGLPTLYSVSENKETDKDTQMLKLDEHFLENYSFMDVDSEYRKSSMTAEIHSDKSNPRTHEVQCSIEQETFSSRKEEITNTRGHKEDLNSSELREAQQSDDVENKLRKDHNDATVMHQSSNSSDLEDKPLGKPLETNIHLDFQLQETCESINDEIHTGIKAAGGKRRLGSSRRFKARQQVKEHTSEPHLENKEDHVETTEGDEPLKIREMTLTTQTTIQEESDDLKLASDIRKNVSTESENTGKLSEEVLFFTHNVMNNRPSDFASNADDGAFLKSNVDIDENDKAVVEETQNIRGVTRNDHMNLTQTAQIGESDSRNTSSHDDNASFTSTLEDVVDQIEASQIQNTEALACDSDSLEHKYFVQKLHDVKGSENRGGTAESSMDVQGLEEFEVGQKCEDPTEEVNAAQEIFTSPPAVDVPFDQIFSPAMEESNNSLSEGSQSGYCEILQVKATQKKRKMGSTRRIQLKTKQEEEEIQEETTDTDSIAGNLVETEVVEQLQVCAEVSQDENESSASSTTYKVPQEDKNPSALSEEPERRGSSPDVQSTDGNVIADINDLLDLFPQQSATHKVNIVSPVNDDDVRDGETEINVTVQPYKTQEFTSAEIQMTSERNRQETTIAEDAGEASWSLMLPIEEEPVCVPETHDQNDDQQNTNDEGLESTNFNVKTVTNRRRKMGSTRKNLGFQTKREELHQKQEEESEATEPETANRDVTEMTDTGFGEEDLQLHSENRDHHSEDKEEILFETVERTHINESQLNPPTQQTAPQSHPVEPEHQWFVSGVSPSSSAAMSELASGGRRRKMGSHRKSRGHQNQRDQTVIDAEDERRVGSIREAYEDAATVEQSEEPSSGDEISEGAERQKKASPSFSDVKASTSLRPASEESPSQPRHADVTLNQESRTQLSLVRNPRGEELRSNGYNVVMIGDSGVGKTSFMKRAQSGKFSLTLSASIGVDSCMWTVVVDGKPVVLHVWDTAGQERFRSITRQVFHRAQAFLLMYDVSASQSFSAISYWATCIQESGAENVVVLLLGNKSDCAERKVQSQQGEALAKECNFGFMECSAATGDNVIESLEKVARMLSQTSGSRREVTVLHKEPEKKKESSRCC